MLELDFVDGCWDRTNHQRARELESEVSTFGLFAGSSPGLVLRACSAGLRLRDAGCYTIDYGFWTGNIYTYAGREPQSFVAAFDTPTNIGMA